MKQEKIIGILGGMGSLATAFYFNKLIQAQHGETDQEFLRVIIDNNTQIPDRTSFIINQTESPLNALLESVEVLNLAKVTHAFMPCFTAHYFYPELKKAANFEFISVFDVLKRYMDDNPNIQKIGILSTSGTQKVGLFNKYFPNTSVIYPDKTHQDMVTSAIYDPKHGIKANKIDSQTVKWLNQASRHLHEQEVDILIAGCTEITMMRDYPNISFHWLDPMMLVIRELLAKEQ